MSHNFVHRGAYTLWEMHIVNSTRVGFLFHNEIMHHLINVVARHTNLQKISVSFNKPTLVFSNACFKVDEATLAADLSYSIYILLRTCIGSLTISGYTCGFAPIHIITLKCIHTNIRRLRYMFRYWQSWCNLILILLKYVI
jgi:hypothetical protein